MKRMLSTVLALLIVSTALTGCGTSASRNNSAPSTLPARTDDRPRHIPRMDTGYFSYENADSAFTYIKKSIPISSLFTAESLKNQNDTCLRKQTYDHFLKINSTFSASDTATDFAFGKWHVVVVPNKPHYKTLADFKNDFDVCGSVGTLIPTQVTRTSLLFTSPCPAGQDKQSMEQCTATHDTLLPTLQLH